MYKNTTIRFISKACPIGKVSTLKSPITMHLIRKEIKTPRSTWTIGTTALQDYAATSLPRMGTL